MKLEHRFTTYPQAERRYDMPDATKAPRITFAEDTRLEGYPLYHNGAAEVIWQSRSASVESFKRAQRKARARSLRLLSYHFSGDSFVAQWGA